jgi:hypothetical protein
MFFCSRSDGYSLSRAKSAARTASNVVVIPIPNPNQDGVNFGELTDGLVESFDR